MVFSQKGELLKSFWTILQVLIEVSLTSILFVHQWLLDLEELRGFG